MSFNKTVRAGVLVAILGAPGCSSLSSSATSSEAARQQEYVAAVSASTSGSGVNDLSQSVALTLGLATCNSLKKGQTPTQVAAGFNSNPKVPFPPEAAAELMVDAVQYLCPHYQKPVQAWASSN